MSLSKNDLQAIKQLMNEVVDERVPKIVQPIVDEAIEASMRQTAASFSEVHEKFAAVDVRFAEVHEKFAKVHERFAEVDMKFTEVRKRFDQIDEQLIGIRSAVGRVERVQRAEVERVDEQSSTISKMRQALKSI